MHFRRANAMSRDILPHNSIAGFAMRAGMVGAIGTLWTARRLEIRDDVTEFWEGLNDRESWPSQCRRVRCYIYSDEDQTIRAKDVERHADEARATGWNVRMEKFHGSGHVQHLKLDPERYWDVVSDFWRSSSG